MIRSRISQKFPIPWVCIATTCVVALLLCSFDAASREDIENSRCDETDSIPLRLQQGTFDPLLSDTIITRTFRLDSSQGYYIIQFRGPILDSWGFRLEALGVRLIGYIPDYAYLAFMDEDARSKVAGLEYVRWTGLYHPGYKFNQDLLGNTGELELTVMVFGVRKDSVSRVTEDLKSFGGKITYDGKDNHKIRVRIDSIMIPVVSFLPDVMCIEKYTPPRKHMDNVREFTGANVVHLNNFNGTGIVGEVHDGGIDTTHPDFAGQILALDGSPADDDHGTCTFGIVFSSGANNTKAKGMLPGAKGVFCDYSVSRTTSVSNLVTNWGGLFQSNSWGMWPDSTYTSESYEDDELVLTYDIVLLYSAGNEGIFPETIAPDAVAKNVIAVGALFHGDNANRNDDIWMNLGWGSTPAQGPAADGRIKPDLSGPFDYVFTTDSVDGDGQDGYQAGDYFDDMGGTSAAAPVCAGAVGLVYQMYRDNHFGNNAAGTLPHASTVKAILIADAYQYDFAKADRFQQGWGGVDVKNVFEIGAEHVIIDQDTPLKTGESAAYAISPTGSGPLKISLVWTDYPGTTSSSQHLVNNLDMKVTDPDGVVYWGNFGLETSKWSTLGGSADSLNNVENVFIETPKPGTWTVEVMAQNVPMDAHPGTPAKDQPFALVASNARKAVYVDIKYPKFNDYIGGVVTVNGTASQGVIEVQVKIDGGSWNTALGVENWTYDLNTGTFSDGPHTIYARAYNGTVYSDTRSVLVNFDNTPPSTSIVIGDPKWLNGSLWYVSEKTQITLSAYDSGSGVSTSWFKILHEGTEVKNLTCGNLFFLTWDLGNYTIEFFSKDNVNNTETQLTYLVFLDCLPPHTSLGVGPPSHRDSPLDMLNVTSITSFTLNPSDEHTGISTTWYTVDGLYYKDTVFNLSGFTEGIHVITWGSVDMVGNNETNNTMLVALDNTPPLVTMTIGEPKYAAHAGDLLNVTTQTVFLLVASDNGCGVDFVWYIIDGLFFYGNTFTMESLPDGLHLISFGAVDHLGNNISAGSRSVVLDSQAPQTSLQFMGPYHYNASQDLWYVSGNIYFQMSASDDYSGIDFTWSMVDGVYANGLTFNLAGLALGNHWVSWGSVDMLGQNETGNHFIVCKDTLSPETDILISSPQFRDDDLHPKNVSGITNFTFLPLDSLSGIDFTWYSIDGMYYTGYGFNLTGFEEGLHIITWGSIDRVKNNETAKEITVYLCTKSPKTALDIQGKSYESDSVLYVTNETVFKLVPRALYQGLHLVWYTIDGTLFEGHSFSLEGLGEGLHTISWGSENNFGENETGNTLYVCLDNLPPVLELAIGEPKLRIDSQGPLWVNWATWFNISSFDEGSGMAETWYEIDGEQFDQLNFTTTGMPDGTYTIVWGSCDNLGSQGVLGPMEIRVDNLPPSTSITIETPYHVKDYVHYVNSTARITLEAQDGSGAGIAGIYYSLDKGESYQEYQGPFAFPSESTSVFFHSVDLLGNMEDVHFVQIIMSEADSDCDGIYDPVDWDDDGDGIEDDMDAYPLDLDNDGLDNEEDTDDDSDGIPDLEDPNPFDTDSDGIRNDHDLDDDGDNIDDSVDPYLYDTDNDGLRNDIDPDDDGDGLLDARERKMGTNPLLFDTDSDGHSDGQDEFPLDKNRYKRESYLLFIVVAALAAAPLVAFLLFWLKRKKKTQK